MRSGQTPIDVASMSNANDPHYTCHWIKLIHNSVVADPNPEQAATPLQYFRVAGPRINAKLVDAIGDPLFERLGAGIKRLAAAVVSRIL